jgi:hypothetical protein
MDRGRDRFDFRARDFVSAGHAAMVSRQTAPHKTAAKALARDELSER